MYKNNLWRAFLQLMNSPGFIALLVNIDRFGNALAGGDYRATVSGRVGYHANFTSNQFWKVMEWIINETFRPLDGPEHCLIAYELEKGWHRRGNDIALLVLAILIVLGCVVLAIPIKILSWFR